MEASEASKKANKLLPRTSVLDKLKTDLGGKQPERCIALLGKGSFNNYVTRLGGGGSLGATLPFHSRVHFLH